VASFLNALLGLSQGQQNVIYWGFSQNGYIHEAVRIGNFKGVRTFGQPVEIFDISVDPGETTDLSNGYPELSEQINSILQTICVSPKRCYWLPKLEW
jgi:hypothetical protein